MTTQETADKVGQMFADILAGKRGYEAGDLFKEIPELAPQDEDDVVDSSL